jgi:hypothetical protein
MKKLLIPVALLASISTANANEFAFGLATDGLTLQIDDIYNVTANTHQASFDYLFFRQSFFYAGGGAGFNWDRSNLALRLPVGLEIDIIPNLEIYGQVAPTYWIGSNVDSFEAAIDGGIRFKF